MSGSPTISAGTIATASDGAACDSKNDLAARSRVMLRDVRWVWRDGIQRFGRSSVLVLLCMIAGLLTGAAALGGVMAVAKAMGAAAPIRIAGLSFDVTTSAGFLLALAIVGGLGLASAGLVYLAEYRLNRLTRDNERALTERAIEESIRQSAALPDSPSRSAMKHAVGRLSRIGARWTAFAYRDLLRCVLYAGMSILAIGAMVWFEPFLTALLVPIAISYSIPLYLVNRGVARCQRRYAAANGPARKRFNRLVSATLGDDEGVNDVERTAARSAMHDAQGLFYQRMLFNQRTAFINATFFIICLLALLGYFGLQAVDEPAWPRILAYLIALRFAWSGLRQLTAMFTKISRFLPEFERYAAFVEGRLALDTEPAAADDDEDMDE